jgi:hypothetical protein
VGDNNIITVQQAGYYIRGSSESITSSYLTYIGLGVLDTDAPSAQTAKTYYVLPSTNR